VPFGAGQIPFGTNCRTNVDQINPLTSRQIAARSCSSKSMHSSVARVIAVLILFSTSSPAEPALVITLPGVADRVRAQNPDLAAARLAVAEALGRMKQSGRLANPELETSLEHTPGFEEGTFELGISQRFPVTNRLRLEKDLSLIRVKAAEAEVREVEHELVAEARQAVIEMLAIRHRRELLHQQSALATAFGELLGAAADRGEMSALDASQARLETASLAMQIRQLDAEEARVAGVLRPLLGMAIREKLAVQGTLAEPVVPKSEVNPANRPDFQVADLAAIAAGQEAKIEQARRYDDIEAGVFAAVERSTDAPNGRETDGIVGIRLKIPLPLRDRNEGAIEAANAAALRKQLEVAALARTIHHQAAGTHEEMTAWAELLSELREVLIPLAAEQVTAAEGALRAGLGDAPAVFRARESRLQLELSRLNALREFHLARVRHEAALGRP
jgi:cobalt-zinc-cadmium efflux system outer membrane protein